MKRVNLSALLFLFIVTSSTSAETIPASDWPTLCDSILSYNRLIRSGSGSLIYEYVLHDSVRAKDRMEKFIDEQMANQQTRQSFGALPDSLLPYTPPAARPRPMVKLVTHAKALYNHVFAADHAVEGYLFVMPARLEETNLLDERPSVAKEIYAWDGTHMQRLVHNMASDGSVRLSGFKNQSNMQMGDVAQFNLLYYANGLFEIAYRGGNIPEGVAKVSGMSRDEVDGEQRLYVEITTTSEEYPDFTQRDIFTFLPGKQYRPVRIETKSISLRTDTQGELTNIDISYQDTEGIWIPEHIEAKRYDIIDGETVLANTRTLEFHDDWVINGDIDPAVFTLEFPAEARVRDYSSGQ